jgi:cytochrome P450
MVFLAKVAQEYGGIARIPIRGKYLYLVSDPELLREIFITHRQKYMKNIRYHHVQALVGQGLLLSEGDYWRHQRQITQPAFHPRYVDAQVGWMADATGKYLDRWQTAADSGAPIDIEPEFIRLAQLLAGHYILGPGFEDIALRFCETAVVVKKHWPLAPRGMLSMLKPQSKTQLKRFHEALAELDDCVFRYIAEHRKAGFEDCGILSLLVQSGRADGQMFTDRELRDQLFTLFFAGHETSATGMCWIHYFLSRHAEVRQRLLREVDSLLGDRIPTAKDLDGLQYTEQVVKESLRVYSPIHAISRVAVVDNTVGGYHVPAGATVYISLYATHRLPRYWPDPERFDPERFMPEQSEARSRFAYIPFAAGHRNCIGAGQAMVELKVVVAQIAQRYVLDLVPGQNIEPAPGTTMYPRYGMKMRLRHATIRR